MQTQATKQNQASSIQIESVCSELLETTRVPQEKKLCTSSPSFVSNVQRRTSLLVRTPANQPPEGDKIGSQPGSCISCQLDSCISFALEQNFDAI